MDKIRQGGSARRSIRKRAVFLPILVVLLTLTGLFAVPAFAVHDTGTFDLEGDASSSVTNSDIPDDWDRVCHQVLGIDCSTDYNTNGATAVSFAAEMNINSSIFTGGGSKDPIDIDQWAWKDGAGGLPDKANLLHSFAARYSLDPTAPPLEGDPEDADYCPNGTGDLNGDGDTADPGEKPYDPDIKCEVLYFGSDRYDNSGDAVQAFWFFQQPVSTMWDSDGDGGEDAPCPISIGGGTGFCDPETGLATNHTDGDLLIISAFSNGGTVATIKIYQWNSLVSGNLELLAESDAAKCTSAGPADGFCGIVNPKDGTTAPWPFVDKTTVSSTHEANTYLQGEFFEGGVNLTNLGLGDKCFSSVASETRTSTSTTSVLKDFVLGGFGKCETSLTTTPVAGGEAIPAAGISIGSGSVSVQDSAILSVSGVSNWAGSLEFFLCEITAGNPSQTCDGTTNVGTQIGTTQTVSAQTPQPILSQAATVTSAGKYCWRGEFTPDAATAAAGVDPDSDSSPGECFTVKPVKPTITTDATKSVEIGNPIDDTATLLGTANQPGSPVINPTVAGAAAGGTITFKLYGPSETASCVDSGTGANLVATRTVTATGDSNPPTVVYKASAGSGLGSLTPTSAGTYWWVASYSGNSPNTLSASGSCGDTGEKSIVTPKQPAITTQATAGPVPVGTALDDTATLTGTSLQPDGTKAGGTITFSLYGPAATPTCTTPIATRTVSVNDDGDYKASNGTGTGSLTPTQPGTYYWIAAYSGNAPNTLPVSGKCGDANEASLVIKLQPTISTAQTFTVKDSATITVAAGAGNLTGTVRFQLFNNATCVPGTDNVNRLYDSGLLPVSGPSPQTVESGTTTITTSKPVLSWLVEYTSGNAGHHNVTHACNIENSALAITNGGTSNTP